tara:strand:- start:469 stop:1566 length:1098 start_codon:yes stop_codon:yes gene_type:complete
MKIREIQIEDYIQIQELHRKYNLNILDKDEWIKFWKNNPCLLNSDIPAPIGWVLENEQKRIVGSLSNILKEYYYNNKKFFVACSHAWIVEDKFRLEAFALLKNFFSQKNIDVFMVTTANESTAKIWLRHDAKKMPVSTYQNSMFFVLDLEKLICSFLKVKKIYLGKIINKFIFYLSYVFLYKKINFWKSVNQPKNVIINTIIDNEFDVFWEDYKSEFKYKFLQSRSASWIRWHIQQKIEQNKAWINTVTENKKILGYAICLERNNPKIGLKRIVIIDLVSLQDNTEVYLSLIKGCVNESKKRGYHMIEAIGFKNSKNRIFSQFKTFNRKFPIFPFYYKIGKIVDKNFLNVEDAWDPSLIDGDSFL